MFGCESRVRRQGFESTGDGIQKPAEGWVVMVLAITVGYVAAWLVTTMVFLVEGRRLRGGQTPPAHPFVVGMLAGAIWPVLLLGVVEYGVLAAVGKVVNDSAVDS
jgi:hypothetical protein